MASSGSLIKQETYIDLPTCLTEHCNGLSMDFGGSVLKVVYRPKDKRCPEGEPPIAEGKERLRLRTFSRDEAEKAFVEIRDLADIRRASEDEQTPIITTGVNCNKFSEVIQKIFRVKSTNVAEMDCFVHCFKEMSKCMTKSEMLDPPHKEGEKWAQTQIDKIFQSLGSFAKYTDSEFELNANASEAETNGQDNETADSGLPLAEENNNLYPCILVMLGSAFATMKIDKDGKFQTQEGSNRGGRTFLGLGSLMTGAKTFDELVALAEKGSDRGVSLYTDDLADPDKDDLYSNMIEGFLLFSFGKTVGLSLNDFTKEDIARGLVIHSATDLAFMVHMLLGITNVSNIFFCGNFANADVIRDEITRALTMRKLSPLVQTKFNFHFMKHGGFLGAIGAFIHKPKQSE